MKRLSKNLKNSLWEYDFEKLEIQDEIVCVRAFCFWEISDIKLLENEIWKEKMKKIFLKNLDKIDKKSINFFKIYFKITNLENNISMYEKLNKPIFTRSFG